MAQTKPVKNPLLKKIKRDQGLDARRTVVEEMFNDYYNDRRNIYIVNFFRGIFFGLGSVLGGTVLVALFVWLLTLFVHVPGIGNTVQQTKDSLRIEQQHK